MVKRKISTEKKGSGTDSAAPVGAAPAIAKPAAAAVTATPAAAAPAVAVAAIPAAHVAVKPAVSAAALAAVATTPAPMAQGLINLRDLNADVAREAAIELGSTRQAGAVEALSAAVRNENNYFHPVVRAAAAESLGRLGDTHAVDALIVATSDSMAEASAEAVRALATLGDKRAVPVLVEIVRNPNGYYLPIVRRAAMTALAKLDKTRATQELTIIAARSNEDPVLRQTASELI